MIMSGRARTALLVLTTMAESKKNIHQAAELSTLTGVSISYIEQLFTTLRAAKIIGGIRGPGGGYVLTRPAREIKLVDVIAAFEGRVAIFGNEDQITKRLFNVMGNATLLEICQSVPAEALHG